MSNSLTTAKRFYASLVMLVSLFAFTSSVSADLVGADIGTLAVPGTLSVDLDNGIVTITGGGEKLWASSDNFYFAYTPITGDATITARLASIDNLQTYTKNGVMFRDSLNPNSMNAFMGTRGGGSTFQHRTSDGAYPGETRVGGGVPRWYRLTRAGDDFSAFISADGVNWSQVGDTVNIPMSNTIYAGFAHSAGNTTAEVTSTFDNITGINITPPPNEPPIADAGPDQTVTDTTDSGDEPVTLDASASTDTDGNIVSYTWSKSGSQIASGINPQVTLGVGVHTITLDVTDDDGDSDSDTVVITVTPYVNKAPIADAGEDQTVADGDEDGFALVQLDGSGSSDSDGSIDSYTWSKGGSQIATGVSPQLTLPFGENIITLDIIDDDGDTGSDTVTINVVAPVISLLPADIGSPALAGELLLDWDKVTLAVGGLQLGGTSDQGFIGYQMLTGDGMVTARIVSYDNAQPGTKAGITIRDSLDADAANAFVGLIGDSPLTFQARTTSGGDTVDTQVAGTRPQWVRLARNGDSLAGYYSSDGIHWIPVGVAASIPMSGTVYIGLIASAGSDSQIVSATFDHPAIANTGNAAPLAVAGDDQTLTDMDEDGTETLTLDGSDSSDYDGSIISYEWLNEGGSTIATTAVTQLTLPIGVYHYTLRVTDDDGAVSTDTIKVIVNPDGTLTPQVISENKSGISLEVLGNYWDDYLVEQWYHEPLIEARCTIYIRDDVLMNLFHNENNYSNTGDSVGEGDIIGVNGYDGIPDTGDEGIIRYRVDQDMTRRAMWADSSVLYPAWPGAQTFADMEYDPGVPVVGSTGPLPGGDITDSSTFYWRGVIDSVGDEWHIIAVGDDDTAIQSYYANRSSDGKIYYFVVNPTTPAMNIVKNDDAAQFYVTPPKSYFVPVIRDQTAYILGDCDIELGALGQAQVQYSLVEEGQPEDWQNYLSAINTIRNGMQPDTRYELKYRIGSDGPVKTRIVHFDPAYPSDNEVHPKNIFWKNGQQGIQRVRDRIHLEPYSTPFDRMLNNPWTHRRTSPYKSTLMTGQRICSGPTLPSSFPLLIDGVDAHPDCSEFLYKAMLDNWLNLDPVGLEGIWSLNSPTREINSQGYANVGTPLGVALSYDWLIKEFRADSHPHGFTAIEDYKLRDNLAAFCNWTAYVYSKPGSSDENGYYVGMWGGAWTHGAAIIAAIMDNYDNDLYGTSGAPGGTFNAPRPWTPYPDEPKTWWEVYNGQYTSIPGYPNQEVRGTFWGLLNEYDQWRDRSPYWNIMAKFYYWSMNFRANFDGYHYPHLDDAIKKIVEGGQIMPTKWNEGALHHCTATMINQNFPVLAPLEYDLITSGSGLSEESIPNSLYSHGAIGVCLYEYDWDTYVDGPQVVSRQIFYNNSSFDGNDTAANVSDDNAIAADKTALLPGETATFANYTSYSKGINGLMIDIEDMAGSPTAADFQFKVGNDSSPAAWTDAPAPSSIDIRPGQGVDGTDRITLIFPDGAIAKQWLQVTVKATDQTGLASDDVFYFGNAIGETGNSVSDTFVDAADEINCRNNPRNFMRPAMIDNLHDFNRDGKVDATDQIMARNNVTDFTTDLELITAP